MADAECVDFIQLVPDYFQRLSDFIWLAYILTSIILTLTCYVVENY